MKPTCAVCGNGVHTGQVLAEYVVPNLPLTVIVVNAAVRTECEHCKEGLVTVPDLPGLMAAAAVSRALHPVKLASNEIAFLRKAIGASGKAIADLMEVTQETVSRWENGKLPMSPTSEKLLRLAVVELLKGAAPAVSVKAEDCLNMKLRKASEGDHIEFRFARVFVVQENKQAEQKYGVLPMAA